MLSENTKGLIIMAAIVAAFIGGVLILNSIPPTVTYTNVYSLGDGSQISGSFALGSGSFREKPVYYYFKQVVNSNGQIGFAKDYVPADETIIIMDQDINPYLKTTQIPYSGSPPIYEFHVPHGTVVHEYSVGVNN